MIMRLVMNKLSDFNGKLLLNANGNSLSRPIHAQHKQYNEVYITCV